MKRKNLSKTVEVDRAKLKGLMKTHDELLEYCDEVMDGSLRKMADTRRFTDFIKRFCRDVKEICSEQ